ncbi:MAG: dihydrofolate reductase [Kiritimatiellae bacterium]|nr:dihydrofolate reductase [Kiritimatiellia bacterium]
MKIHLIWAQDMQAGIGKKGQLPWHISEDLKNFKRLTVDAAVIMGRKTWESLPIKPLPQRRNIVLSSQPLGNIERYSSVEECISVLKQNGVDKSFVIGGSQVYEAFFEKAHELHITCVDDHVESIDTYFPFNMETIQSQFIEVEKKELTPSAIYTRWRNL